MAIKGQEELTSYERIMMTLEGKTPDRTPVFPLVRDWCIKQAGFKMSEAFSNAQKYVFAQYFCMKQYGYDGVRDLCGIHAESEAMGSKINIDENSPPSIIDFAIKDYKRDLPELKIPNPWKEGRLPLILEGVRRLKELSEGKTPVMAYLQAPLRHASMLRGFDKIMEDVHENTNALIELLEVATESLILYGLALVQAGADIIFMSDPTSSGDVLSKEMWEIYGFPYTKKLVSVVKRQGIKTILHVCGDTSDRLESLAATGVDGLSLDHKVDFYYARKILGEKICLMGNLDPHKTLILKGPNEVEKESIEMILKAGKKGGFILSSGCSVPALTRPENICAMVKAAKEFKMNRKD